MAALSHKLATTMIVFTLNNDLKNQDHTTCCKRGGGGGGGGGGGA
jgi:hypothetical protein